MYPDHRSDSVKKNTLLGILIALSTYMYPIATFPYVTRILGPEGLGQVSFVASFAAYFVLVAQLGMPIYGLRSCSLVKENRPALQRIVAELFLVHVVLGFVAVILYSCAVIATLTAKENLLLFLFYGVSVLLCMTDCEWVYKATGHYSFLALLHAAFRLVAIIAVFVLVRNAADLYWYSFISVLCASGSMAAGLLALRNRLGINLLNECADIILQGRISQVLIRHARPLRVFFMMSCAVTVYSNTDKVMLGFMQGNSMVGIYQTAAKMKALLVVLTGALWKAALPVSAALWQRGNRTGFCRLGEKSLCVVSSVSFPLVVFSILFAESCVRIIAGEAYLTAVLPMRILLLTVLSIGVSNIIGGQLLIPIGQEKLLFRAELVGVFSNIAVNAFLIPAYGVTGAALATLLSETLVTVFAWVYIRRYIPLRLADAKNLGKTVLACFVAAMTAYGLPVELPLLLQVAVAFLLYGFVYLFVMVLLRDRFSCELLEPFWNRLHNA